MKTILLTNDDGINAAGLSLLEESLRDLGKIKIISPKNEQSASSHSLTLRDRIGVEKVAENCYAVDGTPTDCVLLGVQGIMSEAPDLIVSGINHGPNMGEDVTYSGTVAAAIEGTLLGIPSLAISSLQRNIESRKIIGAAARSIVSKALVLGVPHDSLLNINIPDPEISPIKGIRITKLGSRAYRNLLKPELNEKGITEYTIDGEEPVWKTSNGTDIAAVRKGYVSITPLHLDLTDYKAIVEMERWGFEL